MTQNTQYWLDLAEYDMETARAMLATKRYLYVGFMCHQTVEKGFKSIISKNGKLPPKIHNLVKLAYIGKFFNDLDEDQKDFLYSLNPLNVEVRYPSYKSPLISSLNEKVCTEILHQTEELLCWIKQQL